MKLTKCPNGHYYDAEKFPSCPHCSGSAAMGGLDKGEDSSTESFGGFGTPSPISMNIPKGGPEDDDVTRSMSNAPQQNFQPGGFAPAQQQKNADDDGKTVGFYLPRSGNKEAEEARKQEIKEQTRPVVGWLVCVDGCNFGRSFELYFGKNFIGRDSSMDVCLSGDNTVSRHKHAILIYEPRQRLFFAQPGEAHELFYLNDEVVLNSVQLKDRDRITIGKHTLVFVPFCDSEFGWE